MSWNLMNLFGDNSNAYNGAQSYFQNAQGQANSQYAPYLQGGTNALAQMQAFNQLRSNPQAYYNQIMQGYQMSPNAQFQMQQMNNNIGNASSADGSYGSPAYLKQMNQYDQGLTSQDQQNYFNNVNGLGQSYYNGLSGLYGGGLSATNALNGMNYNYANQEAQLNQAATMSNNFGINNLVGFGAGLVGKAFGALGGASSGGNPFSDPYGSGGF